MTARIIIDLGEKKAASATYFIGGMAWRGRANLARAATALLQRPRAGQGCRRYNTRPGAGDNAQVHRVGYNPYR